MTISLKEQKEAFVTGHVGTTPLEVLLVCLSAPLGIWCCQLILYSIRTTTKNKQTTRISFASTLLEASLISFPAILCQTIFLYPWGVAILIFLVVIILVLCGTIQFKQQHNDDQQQNQQESQLHFLTCYRSSILYLTFIAILAVDFHVFPRRFAKTEIYGYGLMDMGAASFVFSAGLVSPRARQILTTTTIIMNNYIKTLWHVLPLILLGCIRLATNKGLEYQEHVSEYGVHWNFFFTMAVLVVGSQIIMMIIVITTINSSNSNNNNYTKPSWLVPTVLLLSYQIYLSVYHGQEYIESAPRHCITLDNSLLCNFIAANREGILGCIGYFAVYLMGEYISFVTFPWKCQQQQQQGLQRQQQGRQENNATTTNQINTNTNNKNNTKIMFGISVAFWMLHYILVHVLNIAVSRRSTNISFCIWAMAHNMILLTLIQACNTILFFGSHAMLPAPPILNLVNKHGLVMFVLANLMTGIVNLSINTLAVTNDLIALLIVFIYITLVGMVAIGVDWGISILSNNKFMSQGPISNKQE